jgi:hypothetical protein
LINKQKLALEGKNVTSNMHILNETYITPPHSNNDKEPNSGIFITYEILFTIYLMTLSVAQTIKHQIIGQE